MCLLLSSVSIAGVITPYKTYATNDQVTAANLNGNITTITGEINGGLDNTNADTTNGYRFFEVLGSIPAAGTQGRVVFLTTENTINFDTGAAWNSAVSVTTPTQGDILYYNGTAWAKLAAGTAGYYLATGGAGANPSWVNGSLGAWTGGASGGTYTHSTAYLAATDGFVTAYVTTGSKVVGLTDAANPPTTIRTHAQTDNDGICMPVKKGDYWKVNDAGFIFWIPLGN